MTKPVCESNEYCPLQRARRNKVCHVCAWYTHLVGADPQTGDKFDKWECAVTLLPILLIENARESSRMHDAINQLRNETKEYADTSLKATMLRLGTLLQVAKR